MSSRTLACSFFGASSCETHAHADERSNWAAGSGKLHRVTSRSALISADRPFYDRHADAYDALITDPVAPWVEAVHDRLSAAGHRDAFVLDAGCGTGRYAEGLAAYGYRVALLDASARLLEIARRRCPQSDSWQSDICSPSIDTTFDAVMCRGVANDLTLDEEREAVFASFANLCNPGGMLLLDVREASASARRADGRPRRRTASLTGDSTLTFTSCPSWTEGHIVVDEEYELTAHTGDSTTHRYTFKMRPWTRGELISRLARHGFINVHVCPGVGRKTFDRLFVVAERR